MPSINWLTFVITIPQSYLTLEGGTIYNLDTNQFRMDLRDLEDNEDGMSHPNTHIHNTEVVIAGTTNSRQVLIQSPYSIEFEDGQYTVKILGSNNNIHDVGAGILVQNQVQVIPGNSVGLATPLGKEEVRDAMTDDPSDGEAISDSSIDAKLQQAIDAAIIF
jgi:hypothetical protein